MQLLLVMCHPDPSPIPMPIPIPLPPLVRPLDPRTPPESPAKIARSHTQRLCDPSALRPCPHSTTLHIQLLYIDGYVLVCTDSWAPVHTHCDSLDACTCVHLRFGRTSSICGQYLPRKWNFAKSATDTAHAE